jgi:hypothetical protein
MPDRNFYNKSRVADVVAGLSNFAAVIAAEFASLGLSEEQSISLASSRRR